MGRSLLSPPFVDAVTGVTNLRITYDKSDAMDRNLGRYYYYDFGNRVYQTAKRYGCESSTTACGVYAALSPNNSERSNLEDMARAISTFQGALSSLDNRWERLVVRTYGKNKAKALEILKGANPDAVLKGPKTNAFYHNLLNPNDPYVTVDGHMANIWNGVRVPLDLAGINLEQYQTIVGGIRELAAEVEMLPCQLQSTLWGTWRRIHRIFYNPQYELDFGEEDC